MRTNTGKVPSQKVFNEAKGRALKKHSVKLIAGLDHILASIKINTAEKKGIVRLRSILSGMKSQDYELADGTSAEFIPTNTAFSLLYDFAIGDQFSKKIKDTFQDFLKKDVVTPEDRTVSWFSRLLEETHQNVQELFKNLTYMDLYNEYACYYDKVYEKEYTQHHLVQTKSKLKWILSGVERRNSEASCQDNELNKRKYELRKGIAKQETQILKVTEPQFINNYESKDFDDYKSKNFELFFHPYPKNSSPVEIPVVRFNKMLCQAISEGLEKYEQEHDFNTVELKKLSPKSSIDEATKEFLIFEFEQRTKRQSHPAWRNLRKEIKNDGYYGFYKQDMLSLFEQFAWHDKGSWVNKLSMNTVFKLSANRAILEMLYKKTNQKQLPIYSLGTTPYIKEAKEWFDEYYNFKTLFIDELDGLVNPIYKLINLNNLPVCSDDILKDIEHLKNDIDKELTILNSKVYECNQLVKTVRYNNKLIDIIYKVRQLTENLSLEHEKLNNDYIKNQKTTDPLILEGLLNQLLQYPDDNLKASSSVLTLEWESDYDKLSKQRNLSQKLLRKYLNKDYFNFCNGVNATIDSRIDFLNDQISRMDIIIHTNSIYKNKIADGILRDSKARFESAINDFKSSKICPKEFLNVNELKISKNNTEDDLSQKDLMIIQYCQDQIEALSKVSQGRRFFDAIRCFFRGIVFYFRERNFSSEKAKPRYIRAQSIENDSMRFFSKSRSYEQNDRIDNSFYHSPVLVY